MKNEMTGNIAGPALHGAGAAGRDNLPALIGRIIAAGALVASVAAVRVIHHKSASEVVASLKLPTSLFEACYDSVGANGLAARVAGKGGC